MPDGVLSFFFVLSGFVLRHTQSPDGFKAGGFYIRRAVRILPLHYLTLAFWIWLFFDSWGNSLPDKINSGVANVLLIHSLFNGHLFILGYNAVSWSISVDVFLCAMLPLLLPGRRAIWLFLILAATWLLLPSGVAAALGQAFPDFFHNHPLGRLLDFSAGIALHAVWRRLQPGEVTATVVQVCAALLVVVLSLRHPELPARLLNLMMVLPLCALVMSFAWEGPLTRLLSHRIPVLLGEASFALYMTHHMLFRVLDPLMVGWGSGVALTVAVITAVSLSIAILKLFELPARNLLLRLIFGRRPQAVPQAPAASGPVAAPPLRQSVAEARAPVPA